MTAVATSALASPKSPSKASEDVDRAPYRGLAGKIKDLVPGTIFDHSQIPSIILSYVSLIDLNAAFKLRFPNDIYHIALHRLKESEYPLQIEFIAAQMAIEPKHPNDPFTTIIKRLCPNLKGVINEVTRTVKTLDEEEEGQEVSSMPQLLQLNLALTTSQTVGILFLGKGKKQVAPRTVHPLARSMENTLIYRAQVAASKASSTSSRSTQYNL